MRSAIASVATVALVLTLTASAQSDDQKRANQTSQEQQQTSQQQTRQQQMSASERMLEDRIFVRLAERAWAGADFNVKVNQGVVTLSGTVPSEQTKERILRVTRRTPGVFEVRDQLRVDAAVGSQRGGTAVPDATLSERVAQKIAGTLPGAKAGEDWWFTGWRVEGTDRSWTMIVEVQDGAVTLEGEAPYQSTIRKAVNAALDVPGVRSVRSEVQIEPDFGYGYPYRYGRYPYAYGRSPGMYGYSDPDYFVYYDAPSRAHDFTGVQNLTGDVSKIDRQKGTLTLKTDSGSFDLSFPPSSLQGVQQGDRLSVQLGFRESEGAAASPATSQPRSTTK